MNLNARWRRSLAGVAGCLGALFLIIAQPPAIGLPAEDPYRSPAFLKRLPLEELADVRVSSVSRHPEKLAFAPSAIDVLTADGIRRSGATNIPDVLRLATGVHVAQVNGSTWAISSRGFNNSIGNKMQVLMDGRSLYTPLFSGVFWDVQHTVLQDIQQIEVIRGPGATLWGANAVNGIISIRTKHARDTQGFLFHGGGGNVERGFGTVRYGGRLGEDTFYRVYLTHLSRGEMQLENGSGAGDEYGFTQGGFRLDTLVDSDNAFTLQGDVYTGRFGQWLAEDTEAHGGNFLARWTHELGPDSDIEIQFYYDRTSRRIEDFLSEQRNTYDLEFQHRLTVDAVHDLVWGLTYRASSDKVGNLGPMLAFLPEEETVHLGSVYVQDSITVIPDFLEVTLGSKFEYNNFSGFEVQPTGRFVLRPGQNQTIWGAISRAVRTPSRIDQDLYGPNPRFGGPLLLSSNRAFDSEELIAYELGYRIQPSPAVSIDLALYYNDYEEIRSVEVRDGGTLFIGNGLEGTSYGAELDVKWQALPWWRLAAGYTIMEVDVRPAPGVVHFSDVRVEGNDPAHILTAHSRMDLPFHLEFDTFLRYVSELPDPETPGYFTADVRLGWVPREHLEFAVVCRNLFGGKHPEFRSNDVSHEVERSVFGMVTWRF
jgi:iron complex outermembrane receptor protein